MDRFRQAFGTRPEQQQQQQPFSRKPRPYQSRPAPAPGPAPALASAPWGPGMSQYVKPVRPVQPSVPVKPQGEKKKKKKKKIQSWWRDEPDTDSVSASDSGSGSESESEFDSGSYSEDEAPQPGTNAKVQQQQQKERERSKSKRKSKSSSSASSWCTRILTTLLYTTAFAILAGYYFSDSVPSPSSSSSSPGSSSYSPYTEQEISNILPASTTHEILKPNPVGEFAKYMSSMANFTQPFIRDGLANKERYVYFRDSIRNFCAAVESINRRVKQDDGRSWMAMRSYLEESLELEGKGGPSDFMLQRRKQQEEKRKKAREEKERLRKLSSDFEEGQWVDYWTGLFSGNLKVAEEWAGELFLTEEDKRKRERDILDKTGDNCAELLGIFREMAGEKDKFEDVFELSDHLLVVWPRSASTALSEASKIVAEVIKTEKNKAAAGRAMTEFGYEDEYGRDKGAPQRVKDDVRAGMTVNLDGEDGMRVVSRLGEQIKDFRVLAQACVDMMSTVDRWLYKILPLSEKILEDDKVLDAYLLSDRYKGEIPKRDGWRGEIERLQKALDPAAKRLDHLHGTHLALEHAKNRMAESATTAAGRLGQLERRFDELSTPKGWDQIRKVQGKKTLIKRYLGLSEEMARDLKKRAQNIEKTMHDFKYSLWGEGREWPDVKNAGQVETGGGEAKF